MSERHPPRLDLATCGLLALAPLMWAGSAVVVRMTRDLASPMTLSFVRWLIVFALLLPFTLPVLRRGSGLWAHWRRYTVLGLLGVCAYNALQYLALQTSTPINVTLVGSSLPVWMLLTGALLFGAPVTARGVAGAMLSMAGVLLVLSRGDWAQLAQLRIVAGDLYMVAAAISWAVYSWLLARTHEPAAVRNDWTKLLMAQLVFGLVWSGAFAGGELALTGVRMAWGWPLVAGLAFLTLGPAIVAYRSWALGVQRAGPVVAGFFVNLTPLFAALLSAAFLGEMPHWYHGAAFALILAGIWLSSRAAPAPVPARSA